MTIRQGNLSLTKEHIARLIERFTNIKAEDETAIALDSVFVRTAAFSELLRRQSSRKNTVLLGRKGDGKTAFLSKMIRNIKNPSGEDFDGIECAPEYVLPIDMQDSFFPEMLATFEQLATKVGDTLSHIPPVQVAQILWKNALKLSATSFAIESVTADEQLPENLESQSLLAEASDICRDELNGRPRLRTADISQALLRFLRRQLDKLRLIPSDEELEKDGRDESPTPSPLDVLKDIDPTINDAAQCLLEAGVRVTLTMDRFDDFVDHFVSDDIDRTRTLRRQFLHGLILAIAELERDDRYGWLRIVASLPEDLVVDLNVREIANHEKILFVRIVWTEADLRVFLDRRVSSVIPGKRWSDLFNRNIKNSNKLVQASEECEIYLIRHTTRRPRELMAHALELLHRLRTSGQGVSAEEVPKIVADSNRAIVESQVLVEWGATIPLLQAFTERLAQREPPTVFSFNEFSTFVSKLPIIYSLLPRADIAKRRLEKVSRPDSERKLQEEEKNLLTLSVLFEIGVVGVRVSRPDFKKRYQMQGDADYARYIFSYSQDAWPVNHIIDILLGPGLLHKIANNKHSFALSSLKEGTVERLKLELCISPIFIETLECDHRKSYIIGQMGEINVVT